jgi:tyrosyl-tRNA synthetase
MPLLEGTDGVKKMSKSVGNYIALEDKPADMFGKLMSISDTLMIRYYELLTTEDLAKIKAMHPMEAKQSLGQLVVARYHGDEAAKQARAGFQQKFSEREFPSEPDTTLILRQEDMIRLRPENMVGLDLLEESDIRLPDLVEKTKMVSSKSEARRLIIQGGIEIDDTKETDPNKLITFRVNQQRRLKIGRRKFAIVEFRPAPES